jgi:hypothetical protein
MDGTSNPFPEGTSMYGCLWPTARDNQPPAPKRRRLDDPQIALALFQQRANAFRAFQHLTALHYPTPGYVNPGNVTYDTQQLPSTHQYVNFSQNPVAYGNQMFNQSANEYAYNNGSNNDMGLQEREVRILQDEDRQPTVTPPEPENPLVCYGMVSRHIHTRMKDALSPTLFRYT